MSAAEAGLGSEGCSNAEGAISYYLAATWRKTRI